MGRRDQLAEIGGGSLAENKKGYQVGWGEKL